MRDLFADVSRHVAASLCTAADAAAKEAGKVAGTALAAGDVEIGTPVAALPQLAWLAPVLVFAQLMSARTSARDDPPDSINH